MPRNPITLARFFVHTQLLSGDYLFSTPIDVPSAYFAALTVAFGILFLVSAFVYWRRAKLAKENPVLRRFLRRTATAGMWTSGIGLFLCLMRYIEAPYVSAPILMLLLILSMIYLIGYYVYDLSERYPIAVFKLQESAALRRYRPAPSPAREPKRPRSSNVRGKRKR